MAKNLVHCMSPVTIGLKLDPTYPTRNDTGSSNVNNGAYRTDDGIKTVESGDLVRFGSVIGVVTVDHQDKLADRDSSPVINFGLNVWRVSAIKSVGAAILAGAELWYYDASGPNDGTAVTGTADAATTKATANLSKVFIGKPADANVGVATSTNHLLYKIGTVLDAVAGSVAVNTSVEVRVLIGGVAVCETSAVA